MNPDHIIRQKSQRQTATWIVWLALVLSLAGVRGSNAAVLTESHVKALFLIKFAQYVQWPPAAMTDSNAPILIGVVGNDAVTDELSQAVGGKTIGGHTFVIKHLTAEDDPGGCQILYISGQESASTGKILQKTAGQPILTVGEDQEFANHDGMINFVLKTDNVHLEINVASAKKAGLKISSKLLSVADQVKGV